MDFPLENTCAYLYSFSIRSGKLISTMEILFYVLIGIGVVIALWLVFKVFGGCLLRAILFLGIIALAAFLVFSMIRC